MIRQSYSWAYIQKTALIQDACTPMSTAALFTTTKTQKQPECPSTEWMKTTWPTYMVEYYSAIQKNEVMTFAAT